jgi:hypothetical protein
VSGDLGQNRGVEADRHRRRGRGLAARYHQTVLSTLESSSYGFV